MSGWSPNIFNPEHHFSDVSCYFVSSCAPGKGRLDQEGYDCLLLADMADSAALCG